MGLNEPVSASATPTRRKTGISAYVPWALFAVSLMVCAALWNANMGYRQEILNRKLGDACWNWEEKEVHQLLDDGADANAHILTGRLPSSLEQLVSLFRSGRVKPPPPSDSPLVTAMRAIQTRDRSSSDILTITKLLYQHGANLNAHGEHGMTPLMWAAASDHPALVKLLIQLGADVNALDNQGRTALMYADDDWMSDTEIEKLLKHAGAT